MLLKKIVAAICFFLPSGISRPLFRLVGHRIGKNTILSAFSFVYAEQLELGDDVDIRPFVYINIPHCVIGSNTIISYATQIVGSKGFFTKDNCFIGPHCIIHCEEDVSLGFYSGLGARCVVYSHGSFLPVNRGYPAKFEGVVIEDFVWTAIGVLYLPGSHVGSNCIINAGVVVSSHIPSGTLVQINADQFQKVPLEKVLGFSKRSNQHYHNQIISSFLSKMNLDYSKLPDRDAFSISGGYRFESDPEVDLLSLYLPGKDRAISYDLQNYYCDQAADKLHKAFLSFLRRRFGISLRTDYSKTNLNLKRESGK